MRRRVYDILEGNGSAWYGRVMTALIIASLVPLCVWDESPLVNAVEYVCTAAFVADYAARWATADYKMGRGAPSFLVYPLTPMAIVDLLTILPTFAALNPAWRALRVLRLARALRAFKVVRYSRNVAAVYGAFHRKRSQLCVVVAMAAAYVLVAAMVMFNVEHETFPTFFDAVYWAVISLTTVGYGDMYPTTEIGRVVAMFSSLVGIAVVALPSSIITAGFMEGIGDENGDEVPQDG